MLKKFIPLAAATAALLAFAAPVAQAEGPLITNAFGEAAKTITARSASTTIIHTSAGMLQCANVTLNIGIESNENTTARGKGNGTAEGTSLGNFYGHCGSSSGTVVEVTNVTISDFHLANYGGETKGTTSFSFTYDLRSATGASLIAECTFGGTVPVRRSGQSTLSFLTGEIKKTGGSLFCPSSGQFTGTFTVSDELFSLATIH